MQPKSRKGRKGASKSRAGARLKRSLSFAALSLGIVALALAALVGGLWLRGPASPSAQAPAAAAPQESVKAPVAPPEPAPAQTQSPVPPPPLASAAPAPAPLSPLAGAGAKAAAGAAGPKSGKSQVQSLPASYRPPPPALLPVRKKSLIFIIDDAGYSLKQLDAFLKLPFPLSVAVLPGLPNSEKAALAVRAAGKELMLHQPMQALGGQNPGPGAILLGMGRAEVEAIVEANLKTVPGAIGMNNHMGSAATADLGIMEAVAEVAKKRGIYYLDSLTTSGTAVSVAAAREGIHYWERDVFLDNAPDRASILRAVEEGKKRASKARPAVMIGHVWSAELAQTLTDLYPQLVAEGFSLSTISRFMVEEAAEDDASPGN